MNNVYIERTVLITVLLSEPFDIEFAKDVELQEEWFFDHFHRFVVRQINHDRVNGMMDEMTVADSMIKNGAFDETKYLHIISANPVGSKSSFYHCIDILKKAKFAMHLDV